MIFKGTKRNNYASKWDEAMPIGNGTIGGLVFGNPTNEIIATNHEELFLPLPENSDSMPYNGKPFLQRTRDLLHEGKYREACEYYLRGLSQDGYPFNETIWTNPFETASEIHIDMAEKSVSDYVQKLDFTTGEATVSFSQKDGSVVRKCFVSRSRNVLALEMRKDGDPFEASVYLKPNDDIIHIEKLNIYTEEDRIICESFHSEEESGFVSAAKVITDGVLDTQDRGFKVCKANYLLIFYTLTPWELRMEASKVKILRLLDDMTPDYDSIFKEHEAIHREMFDEVSVSFSDSDREYTNEELKDMCTDDRLAPELLERMTDFGRYLEICSFGKLPPNLQGVWNGITNPPWSSDYTLDENVQMMMWPILPGGLTNFYISYFDWLESYMDDFRKNAESYYGCRGIFSAARVSSDGIHRHFSMEWPMIFWTAGAGWLSREYQVYYEYTGDENILRRGVDFWKEVVLFYEDFMQLDENGRYEFAPSFSPENIPLGNNSPVTINATMDVAVAKEVYSNLINACKLLKIEEDNIERWEKEYSLLPDYAINEDGALKEWIPEYLKDNYHHRHSSHLYPVFPGNEALAEGNEELFNACHKATRFRLIDGVEAISGWGLAHLANISARLEDENLWYLALNRLVQVFTLNNLFTGHNKHSLFQMDANLGLTAAVYEMFVYTDPEYLKLFPVVCSRFDHVSVRGLRAKGMLLIKELSRDDGEISLVIENLGKREMKIYCPDGFLFEDGSDETRIYPKETRTFKAFRQ